MTILIRNGDRTNPHSTKPTFDSADEELVFQARVVPEYDAVMMHVVRGTTILDPDSADLSDRDVDCCLVAVCEAAEYGTVRLAVVVAQVAISAEVASPATATTTVASSSTASRFRITIASGVFGVVFFGNSLVTFRFDVTSMIAMIASDVESSAAGCVGLHDARIGNTQVGSKAGEIQASRFLTNAALEIADGEILDEGHL
jgi:hypothetical protein